jgi:hypothetical protein
LCVPDRAQTRALAVESIFSIISTLTNTYKNSTGTSFNRH